MDKLYNWLFHYNHHTEKWTAFHREDTTAYWNGTATKYPVFVHKDYNKVIELVQTLL
jgi:hypothetical protein